MGVAHRLDQVEAKGKSRRSRSVWDGIDEPRRGWPACTGQSVGDRKSCIKVSSALVNSAEYCVARR